VPSAPVAHPGRTGLVVAFLVGAALRLWPIHRRYLFLEMQEHLPRNAVVDLVRGDWAPFGLHHGAAFLYLLRAVYTLWYAFGRAAGVFRDRLDVLAAFVTDTLPFVLVGRVLAVAASLAGLLLVWRLGRRTFGPPAGVVAVLLLAVGFSHVRESHHVFFDVPAGTLAVAAVLAALRLHAAGGAGAALVAGLAGGAAIACKHSAFPIVLPVGLAAVLAPDRRPAALAARAAAAGVGGTAALLVLSPYVVLAWDDTLAQLRTLSAIAFGAPTPGLPLPTLLDVGYGRVVCLLALVGLAAAARARPAETLIVAAFPAVFLVLLVPVVTVYARYLATPAPFVALFAGGGAVVVGRALVRRRPGLGVVAVAAVAAAGPALQSLHYVRALGRTDTRHLAGAWIRAHVPPGTRLTLPNAVPYPNPVLPPGRDRLQLDYPEWAAALAARGVGDPARTWPARYLKFFGADAGGLRAPSRFVVVAHHPVALADMNVPPAVTDTLRARGGRVVARFAGVAEPVPDGLVFDPIDADYVPLVGAERLERPGPNLTIWEMPG
jgi:hypothetical protein